MKNKKLLLISLLGILVIGLFVIPNIGMATGYGLEETAGAAGILPAQGYPSSLQGLIGNIIGAGLSFVGVLFFALMLFAGFNWMTAHGNQEQEKKALDTIMAAVIGIAIVIAAYALTNFIFNNIKSSGTTSPLQTRTPQTPAPVVTYFRVTGTTADGCKGPPDTCGFVAIRSSAGVLTSPSDNKIGQADENACVVSTGKTSPNGNWKEITSGTVTGWAYKDYLGTGTGCP